MKCRAYVVVAPTKKKPDKIKQVGHGYSSLHGDVFGVMFEKPEDAELCNGRVIIKRLEAVDEPFYGGHSASLEIEFMCERCGNTYFANEVPTDGDSLRLVVQKYLDTI